MSNVEMSVPRSIRTGDKEDPYLDIKIADSFSQVWSDVGSKAKMHCTVWRPNPYFGYFILGDYAQGNYDRAVGAPLIVKPVNDNPERPLLMPPTGWKQVWNDKHGGAKEDGSFWEPIPPMGYHALGHVAFPGNKPDDVPNIPNFRCVLADSLWPTNVRKEPIWTDKGSGAKKDCTLFSVDWDPNLFLAQGSYAPSYTGAAFMLRLAASGEPHLSPS